MKLMSLNRDVLIEILLPMSIRICLFSSIAFEVPFPRYHFGYNLLSVWDKSTSLEKTVLSL